MHCDTTGLDRIMNKNNIRVGFGVTNETGKMRENTLRWFGHIEKSQKDR